MCNLRYPGSPPSEATIHASLKAIGYACSFWVDHLTSSLRDESSDSLCYKEYLPNGTRVYGFLLKHFLHWFEALSLIGEVDRGILGLQSLERTFERLATQQSETSLLKDFVHDAVRVMRQFRPAVEEAPLQVYCSTLIFSPEQSLVRQNFKQEVARWIAPLPRITKTWSSCLQTLEGHTDSVYSVVFSPNGQHLASCSGDGTVRLWDVGSGACLQTLEGHTNSVNSVVFSHNGQQLVSCSYDHTVRLWDAGSGACLQTLEGHTGSVNSVVFSPNGQHLVSCSYDGTVRLWDAGSGGCLQTLEGYTDTIIFSSGGSNLVTDFGVFSVGQPKSDIAPKQVGLSIGSEKWITWNGHNILWLPPEYRAVKSAAEENRIGVGCSSGMVYILSFHPDSFPN